jgi:hypothetical protein
MKSATISVSMRMISTDSDMRERRAEALVTKEPEFRRAIRAQLRNDSIAYTPPLRRAGLNQSS